LVTAGVGGTLSSSRGQQEPSAVPVLRHHRGDIGLQRARSRRDNKSVPGAATDYAYGIVAMVTDVLSPA
jgi:hypothetical protein